MKKKKGKLAKLEDEEVEHGWVGLLELKGLGP